MKTLLAACAIVSILSAGGSAIAASGNPVYYISPDGQGNPYCLAWSTADDPATYYGVSLNDPGWVAVDMTLFHSKDRTALGVPLSITWTAGTPTKNTQAFHPQDCTLGVTYVHNVEEGP
jgi:hypothetical protein